MRKFSLFCLMCGMLLMTAPDYIANAMVVNQENEETMKDREEVITSDTVLVEKENGKTITVNVQEQAKGEMTYAELYAITSELSEEDCEVTIYEILDVNVNKNANTNTYMSRSVDSDVEMYNTTYTKETDMPRPRAWYDLYYNVTIWKYHGSEIEYDDDFIISVAKGQNISLSKKYTYTLNAQVSTEESVPNVGTIKSALNSSITHEISKSETFSGPSENSTNNSREYRCKYYMNEGIWVSKWVGNFSGDEEWYSGWYLEPTRYARYSVDRYIK